MDQESLIRNGFTELHSSTLYSDTLSLAKSIGCVLDIPNLSLIQTLKPRLVRSTTTNTYSGNYGLNEFPLHTDLAHWYLPPRFFILRCIEPDPNVSTILMTKEKALQGLSSLTLRRAIFKPRRKFLNRQSLLRIVQNDVFRWDEKFIAPQNDEAQEVAEHIKKLRQSKDVVHYCFTTCGQALLIDNWKVLHGRSEVNGRSSPREIERVYLTEIKN